MHPRKVSSAGGSALLWRRIFATLIAALFVAGVLSLALIRHSRNSNRKLKIGFQDSAPYHFPDADGKPSGSAVTILQEAARRKHISLEWVFSPQGPDSALASGSVDLWPIMADLPERRHRLYITAPWSRMTYVLIAQRSLNLKKVEDLGRRSLAVASINLDTRVAKEHFGEASIITIPNNDLIIETVCSGKTLAGLLSKSSIARARSSECPERPLHALSIPNSTFWFGIGTAKGNGEAQEVADMLREEIGGIAADGSFSDLDFQLNTNLSGEINTIFQYNGARKDSFWLLAAFFILVPALLRMIWLANRWKKEKREAESAREALLQSEERLRLTLGYSGIGVWSWEIAPDLVVADENCSVLFGLSRGQFPKSIHDCSQLVHPDERKHILKGLNDCVKRGSEYKSEFRVIWPNGTVRSLAARGKVLCDSKGVPHRLIGVCWDFTERLEAEENLRLTQMRLVAEAKFRGLLEAAPDAVVVVNLRKIIVLVNAQVEKLFGYSREELLGQTIDMLLLEGFTDDQPERPMILSQLPHLLANGTGTETTGFCKDGTVFPAEFTISPTMSEEGVVVTYAIRDITERKRVEQQIMNLNCQLEAAATQAKAADRAKSTFLSTMSHEIRTPMTAILGYAQLMLRDPDIGSDAKANLRIIGRSGEHLLSIINDVLDMSKLEAGRTALNPVTFNLNKLLYDLVEMFRLRARSKALRFEHSVGGESIPYVVGDEGKIRQVLINLLGNAVKFTDHGHIKIHVALDRRAGNQLWLSANVEDSGLGLSKEEQGRLFEPFSQLHRGLQSQEGTGLGLAISRKYAQVMGGDLTVAGHPGVGSTFRMEVPVEVGDSGIAAKKSVLRRVTGLRDSAETPRVLVVDDQFENRDWLTKLLTTIGFSARGADNGDIAIAIWREWRPSLILMDAHMPVLDGITATRKIKSDPQGTETAIVVLTAGATDDDRKAVLQSGADGFLTKPCREDELLEKIRIVLSIAYDYVEEDGSECDPPMGSEDLNADSLKRLPRPVLDDLITAISSGNKKQLDQVILRVKEMEDAGIGRSLQKLADNYEYDSLMQLLEGVCS